MSNAAGQRANCLHFLSVQELAFQVLSFTDIAQIDHTANGLAVHVTKHCSANTHRNDFAFFGISTAFDAREALAGQNSLDHYFGLWPIIFGHE